MVAWLLEKEMRSVYPSLLLCQDVAEPTPGHYVCNCVKAPTPPPCIHHEVHLLQGKIRGETLTYTVLGHSFLGTFTNNIISSNHFYSSAP